MDRGVSRSDDGVVSRRENKGRAKRRNLLALKSRGRKKKNGNRTKQNKKRNEGGGNGPMWTGRSQCSRVDRTGWFFRN